MSPQPFYPELLTDAQLHAVANMQKGVQKLAELAQRLNTMIIDHKLPIKPMPVVGQEAGRVSYELEGVLFNHDLDMAKLRKAAGASPERLAA